MNDALVILDATLDRAADAIEEWIPGWLITGGLLAMVAALVLFAVAAASEPPNPWYVVAYHLGIPTSDQIAAR